MTSGTVTTFHSRTALGAPVVAISVSVTRGLAAAWQTALAVDRAETLAASAVVGGAALDGGFPCT